MILRLRFALTPPLRPNSAADLSIFQAGWTPQRKPWLAMLGSLLAHCVVTALIPLTADQLARIYSDDVDWSAYQVETMRLRVPEAIYYAAPGKNSTRDPVSRNGRNANPHSASGRGRALSSIPIPKGLELPVTAGLGPDAPALLQPDTLPKIESRPIKLAALAFWAPAAARRPKPRRDDIIKPGRAEQATPPPGLAAPPSLAIPNREPILGRVNIAAAPPVPAATLPVTASATAPVRDPSSDARNGALDGISGQPANVISLSREFLRPREIVAVPRGSTGMGAQGQDSSGMGAQGQEQGPAEGGPHKSQTAVAAGSAETSFSANAAISRTSAATGPAATGGGEGFTRITHPRNGIFDVVITGAQADMPASAIRLTGSPVYTVYLRVGDGKEWMLTFCLPTKETRDSTYEVFVEDTIPLDPPYPIKTTVPNAVFSQRRPTPLVFHGLLTAAGEFRGMEGNEADPLSKLIVSVFDEWQFRPARKNDIPTDIQVALIVPATEDRRGPLSY